MQKPNRFLLDRVASYAEEGSAFLRRRRIRSQPSVRLWRPGRAVEALDVGEEPGRRVFAAGAALIAGTEPEPRR